jgi:hypothetical protein
MDGRYPFPLKFASKTDVGKLAAAHSALAGEENGLSTQGTAPLLPISTALAASEKSQASASASRPMARNG